MARLSVVVCVYNTDENYFSECLESIYNSTMKDIEVVVVDDGSSKDYSNLLQKFKDIKYIKTENQGTLAARILGVKNSTAPYVCFVDSDDYMSFIYFEAGIEKALNQNAEVVINDWAFNTVKTKYVCLNDTTINQTFNLSGEKFLTKYFEKAGREHSYYVLWNKIFKREILLSACEKIESLRLNSLTFAEDVLITYFVFLEAKNVANLHLGNYFYRVHGSQQVAVTDENKLRQIIDSMTIVFDIIETDLTNKNIFDKHKAGFLKWKQLLCSVNFYEARKYKSKELFDFISKKYKNCKLTKLPKDYGKAYLKQRILPVNINQIDLELKNIYYSNKSLKVYARKKSYAFRFLVAMKKIFDKKFKIVDHKYEANVVISKEKISLKQKIIHNEFIYKIGMLLFPKGSKIRQYLKSKL